MMSLYRRLTNFLFKRTTTVFIPLKIFAVTVVVDYTDGHRESVDLLLNTQGTFTVTLPDGRKYSFCGTVRKIVPVEYNLAEIRIEDIQACVSTGAASLGLRI